MPAYELFKRCERLGISFFITSNTQIFITPNAWIMPKCATIKDAEYAYLTQSAMPIAKPEKRYWHERYDGNGIQLSSLGNFHNLHSQTSVIHFHVFIFHTKKYQTWNTYSCYIWLLFIIFVCVNYLMPIQEIPKLATKRQYHDVLLICNVFCRFTVFLL